MYTTSVLQPIFQSSFDKEKWNALLIEILETANLELHKIDEVPQLDNTTPNEMGYYLGKKTMADELELGLFYYKLNAGSVLHKRVGLRIW